MAHPFYNSFGHDLHPAFLGRVRMAPRTEKVLGVGV